MVGWGQQLLLLYCGGRLVALRGVHPRWYWLLAPDMRLLGGALGELAAGMVLLAVMVGAATSSWMAPVDQLGPTEPVEWPGCWGGDVSTSTQYQHLNVHCWHVQRCK